MRHLTRTARATAAIGAAALLLAGCGLGGTDVDAETASSASDTVAPEPTDGDEKAVEDGGGEPAPSEDATDDVAADEPPPATDGPVVADESEPQASDGALPPPAAATGDPIVSVEGTSPWIGADILDLRRDGDVVTLDFTIRTDDSDPNGTFFADVFTSNSDTAAGLRDRGVPGWPSSRLRYTVSGVTLIDRTNANRHLVLRDSDEVCLCTEYADINVDPNSTLRHSAQFPAPPADVTEMTVEIPTFPSIDGVPIRDAN